MNIQAALNEVSFYCVCRVVIIKLKKRSWIWEVVGDPEGVTVSEGGIDMMQKHEINKWNKTKIKKAKERNKKLFKEILF